MLAVALAAASVPTLYSDAMPPARFQGDANPRIEFVRPLDVQPRCAAIGMTLKLRVDDTLLACSRNGSIVIPNPCLYAEGDGYARILCHELGHVNGWPKTHGD